MDIGSDSIFTACTVGNTEVKDLDAIWFYTFKSSAWQVFHLPVISLVTVLQVSFIVSLLQLVMPLATSYRKEECRGNVRLNEQEISGVGTPFLTGETLSNEDVFLETAEAAQLATVQSIAIPLAKARMQELARENDGAFDEWVKRLEALQRAAGLSTQIIFRVLLSYLGENCLQLYIQSIVFAITCCLMTLAGEDMSDGANRKLQSQQLVSIAVSMVMTCTKLVEAASFFGIAKQAGMINDIAKDSRFGYSCPLFERERMSNMRRIRLAKWCVGIGSVLMISSLILTACKLLAVYRCPSSLWNVTSAFGPTRGCVPLEQLAKALA